MVPLQRGHEGGAAADGNPNQRGGNMEHLTAWDPTLLQLVGLILVIIVLVLVRRIIDQVTS